MCMPTFVKCYCRNCHRFYTISFGDCLPARIDYHCPHCRKEDYYVVPREMSNLDFLANLIWEKISKNKEK